jgi:hypothetical protein
VRRRAARSPSRHSRRTGSPGAPRRERSVRLPPDRRPDAAGRPGGPSWSRSSSPCRRSSSPRGAPWRAVRGRPSGDPLV